MSWGDASVDAVILLTRVVMQYMYPSIKNQSNNMARTKIFTHRYCLAPCRNNDNFAERLKVDGHHRSRTTKHDMSS